MRPSSKVWKSMLYGRWAESKPTHGEWIVQLPNDKAAPFTVLLAISHGRFNLMPDIMTRDLLVDIFSTCDFHDTTHILCPWAQAWTQLAVPSVSSTVSVVDSADQLPISDDSLGLTVPEVSQVLYIAWAMRCVAELNKLLWGLMLGESAEVLKDLISHNTQSQDQGILTMPTELLGKCHGTHP